MTSPSPEDDPTYQPITASTTSALGHVPHRITGPSGPKPEPTEEPTEAES